MQCTSRACRTCTSCLGSFYLAHRITTAEVYLSRALQSLEQGLVSADGKRKVHACRSTMVCLRTATSRASCRSGPPSALSATLSRGSRSAADAASPTTCPGHGVNVYLKTGDQQRADEGALAL